MFLQTHQLLICFLPQTISYRKAKHSSLISKWTTGRSHLLSIGSKFLKIKLRICTRSSNLFDQLDHKFGLLLSGSMMTPLITTHSVVCAPSQATEITPSPLVRDSQVNHRPPAPITVTSDVSVLKPEMHTSTKPIVPQACTGSNSQLVKAPPDSKPIPPSASMIIKTSTPYRRSKSYAPPTKASDNPIDLKMRPYKPLRSLINLSRIADGEPRIPFATRKLLAT